MAIVEEMSSQFGKTDENNEFYATDESTNESSQDENLYGEELSEKNIGSSNQESVENKEELICTSEYNGKSITDKDQKVAEDLLVNIESFLASTCDVHPDAEIRSTVPSGLDALDTIMGGGAASAIVQIVGPPGTGKSGLVSRFIATGQKKWPGKFISIYCDSEQSQTKERLAQLGIVHPQINPYTDITVEKIFQIVEGLCAFKDKNKELMDIPSVVAWDSIANTLTEKGSVSDDVNSVLGEKARILSHLLPKYVKKIKKYNICLLCINQTRDKIDMGIFKQKAELQFLHNKTIPGGNALAFNSVQLLMLSHGQALKEEFGFQGTRVKARLIKNKLFSPNIEIPLVFSYERGFSNFWSNFEFLKGCGRIKGGAWHSLEALPTTKFRQAQAFEKYLTSEEFKTVWDEQVKDTIKTEFLDRRMKTTDSTLF